MTEFGIDTLERALEQLKMSLNYCESNQARCDPTLAQVFRSAAIQGFEFTFEVGHKVLRRYLAETAPLEDIVNELSFPDLIRKGYDRGIVVSEWKHWQRFRRLRNMTSHTYAESAAAEVFDAIPDFAREIAGMLGAIRKELRI